MPEAQSAVAAYKSCPVDWDRLRVFQIVAKSGSFTKAGALLNLSQSAVSRQICGLEELLRVTLFYRHARGLLLTEQGEEFYRSIQDVEAQIGEAISRVTESRTRTEGPLKITTTVAFGSAWLTRRISRFHELYPDIAVSMALVDGPELDLFSRQADVAIRFVKQTHPRIIQLKLMSIRYRFFASPDYVLRRGRPECVEDLDKHELIAFGSDMPLPFQKINWILEAGRGMDSPRRPALYINSVYGMYRAAKSGLGIAPLPYYISEESPDLVEVLPEVIGPSIDAYFVYPEELRSSKRVAVIRDFLVQQAAEERQAGAQCSPAACQPESAAAA
jgi:DNA-binding transcriptional LysR family regulator